MTISSPASAHDLDYALSMGTTLLKNISAKQWSAPTPCTDWNVRQLLTHVVGMNMVFTALLSGQQPPSRDSEVLGADPAAAYERSARELVEAFSVPGVLEREFKTPMGSASGADRLQIRLYDLLAHLWDLARATTQDLDHDHQLQVLAEKSLAFATTQISQTSRVSRFDPPQPIGTTAPAMDRLAAFLGRPADWRAPQ